MTILPDPRPALSVPPRARAPRALNAAEIITIERVADALVPALGVNPAASAEPGFREQLEIALDARADAFHVIVDLLTGFASVADAELLGRLEALNTHDPNAFQALSTVVAGAWLLTSGARARIGYRGLRSNRPGMEDAADELASGILDPVMERYPPDSTRWIR